MRIRAFNPEKANFRNGNEIGNKEKAVVLIHGIYGAKNTFGDLPEIIQNDEDVDVFLADYWSTGLLPNFRSLSELGNSFADSISEKVIKQNKIQKTYT